MNVIETRRSNIAGVVPWIIGEAKKGTHSIGFIPNTHYDKYDRDGQIAIAIDQNELIAFIVFGDHPPRSRVWQIWTRNDARREAAATALIEWLKIEVLKRGCSEIQARVKTSLDANLFWSAANFHLVETAMNNGRRKQPINVWRWYSKQIAWLPGFQPEQAPALLTVENIDQSIQTVQARLIDRAVRHSEEAVNPILLHEMEPR